MVRGISVCIFVNQIKYTNKPRKESPNKHSEETRRYMNKFVVLETRHLVQTKFIINNVIDMIR